MQKKISKLRRGQSEETKVVLQELTLCEMFERFMTLKKTEGLAPRTIRDYYTNFEYFKVYIEGDLTCKEVTTEIFRGFVGYMLHEKNLSPVTANVRIRTLRAFIRFCYIENYISVRIHESFKPVKTPQDTLESFTPSEIKQLLSDWKQKKQRQEELELYRYQQRQ